MDKRALPAGSRNGVRDDRSPVVTPPAQPRLRTAVERVTGQVPNSVARVHGGHGTSLKYRAEVDRGNRYFLKVVHRTDMPLAARLLTREVTIASVLPTEVPAPQLEGFVEDDPWLIAVFRYANHVPWASSAYWPASAASPLVNYMTGIYGITGVKRIRARRIESNASRFTGFRQLSGRPKALEMTRHEDDLEWLQPRLTELAELERRALPFMRGDTLLHCDLSPGNVLRTSDGLMLVDWAHARLGCPVVDLVAMLMRVDAQSLNRTSLITTSRLGTGWTESELAAVIAALSGMFLSRALLARDESEAMNRVRLRYGLTGLSWLQELL